MILENRLNTVLSLAKHTTEDSIHSPHAYDSIIALDLNTDVSTVDATNCTPHMNSFGASRAAHSPSCASVAEKDWHARMECCA